MLVLPHVCRKYPKLADFIYFELSKVKWTKPDVWKAFLKYSELSDEFATQMMITCSMPIIDVEALTNANGEFRGGDNPDIIYLDETVCERFEQDYPKEEAKLLVESTILHEMVHWGDWKDGSDQPDEEGKAFEKEAYGYDVNRYW